ncbi:accessory Sec system glycosyltransferase GtfA [Limosilactobacillus sp.]|uniref:accessory Sec system glycosyltransferase GtfA n=1 Tax=Limosilactobacillus sp. TaxID=2773925 RepID=UPI00359F391C
MTVYNVDLGIGWASSGVEYAQSYRNQAFKSLKIPAKFIFSDLILDNNIEVYTKQLGYDDDQIIWFYNFFTDIRIAPSTYSLVDLEKVEHFSKRNVKCQDNGQDIIYTLPDEQLTIRVHLSNQQKQTVYSVSYEFNGCLIRRDFYSYVKYVSEFYNGDSQNNIVAYREFYNEDGSVAYTQYPNGKDELFVFPDQIYYSKNALYLKMLEELNFQPSDIIILDRMDDGGILINGQLIFEHHLSAKLVVVVHADHYDKHYVGQNILWNNFYEYQFTHPDDVAAFIVATDKQNQLFKKQERRYQKATPRIVTIPVGNLTKLMKPTQPRKAHSMITASRLADEKHIDWLIRAAVIARQTVPDLTLDIYGYGGELDRLQKLIESLRATDYIRLMGQHDLTNVYERYAAYVAASTSEGFGLSLMEAVGSGLPMIGFDVPYGNQTFIENGQNGHLIPYHEDDSIDHKVKSLASAMIKLFTTDDLHAFSKRSYALAEPYLQKNVAQLWYRLLGELQND